MYAKEVLFVLHRIGIYIAIAHIVVYGRIIERIFNSSRIVGKGRTGECSNSDDTDDGEDHNKINSRFA